MTDDTAPARREDEASGLIYRLRPAQDPGAPAYLLLHGLTGDEDVMWGIESGLPGQGLAAAPRGLFEASEGGYSWVEEPLDRQASVRDLSRAVEAVTLWIETLRADHGLDLNRTVYVGFSQGASLAFALAASSGARPGAVVCLSGTVPHGEIRTLKGLPVFWGHGTHDQTLPIERAREGAARLREIGAQLHFCEADVGHKVGVECMRGLRGWLEDHLGLAV